LYEGIDFTLIANLLSYKGLNGEMIWIDLEDVKRYIKENPDVTLYFEFKNDKINIKATSNANTDVPFPEFYGNYQIYAERNRNNFTLGDFKIKSAVIVRRNHKMFIKSLYLSLVNNIAINIFCDEFSYVLSDNIRDALRNALNFELNLTPQSYENSRVLLYNGNLIIDTGDTDVYMSLIIGNKVLKIENNTHIYLKLPTDEDDTPFIYHFEKYFNNMTAENLYMMYLSIKHIPQNINNKDNIIKRIHEEFSNIGINISGDASTDIKVLIRIYYLIKQLTPTQHNALKNIVVSKGNILIGKNGRELSGLTFEGGNTLYIPENFTYKTFYHEISHLVTYTLSEENLKEWEQLSLTLQIPSEFTRDIRGYPYIWSDLSTKPLFACARPYCTYPIERDIESISDFIDSFSYNFSLYEDIATFFENFSDRDYDFYKQLIDINSSYYQNLLHRDNVFDTGPDVRLNLLFNGYNTEIPSLKMTEQMAKDWINSCKAKLLWGLKVELISRDDYNNIISP